MTNIVKFGSQSLWLFGLLLTAITAPFHDTSAQTFSSSHSQTQASVKKKKKKSAKRAGVKNKKQNKKNKKVIEPASYILFEPATGRVIKHHNADRLTYPASLAKIMTAYVIFEAVEAGEIKLKDNIVISDYARSQPPTRVGLRKGIDVTLDTALRSLIIRSANDFAVAISETLSGSEAIFVSRMNATARRLGMLNTHFANPHGLPNPRQKSTARDMALLASALIRDFPQYKDVFSQIEVKIRSLTLRTHNSLLVTLPGTDGIKTGFTCASGYNIVASATRDNKKLVAVVIGALTGARRTIFTRTLLQEGFVKAAERDTSPKKRSYSLASLPVLKDLPETTLDLSRKTRTWKCGNGIMPRRYRKSRKRGKRRSGRKRKKR